MKSKTSEVERVRRNSHKYTKAEWATVLKAAREKDRLAAEEKGLEPLRPQFDEPLYTDHDVVSLVYSMWHDSLNLTLRNLSLCLASRIKVGWSEEFEKELHAALKRLVREGRLRRQRFQPGKPYYTIA